MIYKTFVIPILCGICGAEGGHAEVSEMQGWTKEGATLENYNSQQNVVDNRCDACEVTHGSFTQLAEEYIEATNHDWSVAELFVKENNTRDKFTPALEAVVADIEAQALVQAEQFDTKEASTGDTIISIEEQ